MQKNLAACAAASALCAAAAPVFAQSPTPPASELPEVTVTGSPLGSGLFELVQPAELLTGRRLDQLRSGSLGATLESLPGMSASSFGPGASRPIIRGLDGDRVRILQNGVGTLDASSLSNDHAVPYDPLGAERIEVVRGPAAVLYGGNAVGGVVNIIDNRIPDQPISGFAGRGELAAGGAARERSVAGLVEAGNGAFALHADGFARQAGELRIPGFARSARQRAIDGAGIAQPQGTLPNSSARSEGGAIGASATWQSGYAGLSYRSQGSNYGSVAEQAVRIDMQSDRWDFAGEVRDLSPLVSAVKFKLGATDYVHRELDNGATATTFRNKGYDSRVELVHGKLGPFKGTFGLSLSNFDFSATGAEAFVPATNTDAKGAFLYEELQLERWKFSVGARGDRTRVGSGGGGPIDPATGLQRFDPAISRSFSMRSGSIGALYGFDKDLVLAVNATSTQRAPTYYELFANGPHAATGAYEVGDATLAREQSRGIDASLRWKRGPNAASLSMFRQKFRNFVTAFGTGNTRGADGEPNPADLDGDGVADGSGEEVMPEFQYRAVPARFTGFEASGRMRVYERTGTLDVELRGERVRAVDTSTGAALPRIAPTRVSMAIDYAFDRFGARMDVIRASAQNRVAAGELPTDGYTLVNAYLGYRFRLEGAALEAFARVNNLFDREIRYHSSMVKDLAPQGGRAVLLGLRGNF